MQKKEAPRAKRSKRKTKLKKLEEKLEEEKTTSNEYLNRLKYLQADFENYRKRIDKELHEVAKLCNERLIKNLLSVIDELELALSSGRDTKDKQAFLEGVEMTLKKMYTALESEGLSKIEALGKTFNPKLHEVMTEVSTKDYDENIIIEEVRKGFMLGEKVIRPSIVNVAKGVDIDS